jgi:hypothetical protein
MKVTKNILTNFEVAIQDNYGKFVSGLTVTYEVRKCSDDSVVTSGTATETNNVYHFSYTFTTAEQYRLEWTTPAGYEDGFDTIEVEASAEEQILLKVADGTYTVEDLIKAMAAILLGKTTITNLGGGLATVAFRDLADALDRVVADMNGSNRTNVTITP